MDRFRGKPPRTIGGETTKKLSRFQGLRQQRQQQQHRQPAVCVPSLRCNVPVSAGSNHSCAGLLSVVWLSCLLFFFETCKSLSFCQGLPDQTKDHWKSGLSREGMLLGDPEGHTAHCQIERRHYESAEIGGPFSYSDRLLTRVWRLLIERWGGSGCVNQWDQFRNGWDPRKESFNAPRPFHNGLSSA